MTCGKPSCIGTSFNDRTTISLRKKEQILRINDTKLDKSLVCKVPALTWGGLAALCAGLAIVGAVLLCVATGGAAAPFLLAAAAAVTKAVVVTAAVISIASIGIGIYEQSHMCDKTGESQWQLGHSDVTIEGEKALLNRSFMYCPAGGALNIIIDPAIAYKAAAYISNCNNGEIALNRTSKFILGGISALTGGASWVGLTITVGFEGYGIWNTYQEMDTFSPETGLKETSTAEQIAQDARSELIQAGLVYGIEEVGPGGMKMIRLGTEEAVHMNEAVARSLAGQGDDAINASVHAAARASLEADDVLRSLGKEALKGLAGATVNFIIDQLSNWGERALADMAKVKMNESDSDDSSNIEEVNIIATNIQVT